MWKGKKKENNMIMKELEIKDRTPGLVQQLLRVWEKSVRETHLFCQMLKLKD